MSGLSATGLGLPAGTNASPVAASPLEQPGLTVQSQAGTTTLPAARGTDFAASPTPLDKPHPTYPTLITSHVAVLEAIGTPAAVIKQLAAQQPQAEYLDQYIQNEIMQHPEAWDAYVGNPAGTARAGLQQLMPNVPLPASDAAPGVVAPDMPAPSVLTPAPQATGGGGIGTGLLIAGGVAGAGLVAWKIIKGRGAGGADDAARAVAEGYGTAGTAGSAGAPGAAGAAGAMGAGAAGAGLRTPTSDFGHRLMNVGAHQGDMGLVQQGGVLNVLGTQGASNVDRTSAAATAYGVMNGLAPGDGYVQSNHAAALFAGISEQAAHRMSLENRMVGVIEQLARNGGTLEGLAAAKIVANQAAAQTGGAGAQAGAAHMEGVRQMLAGMTNMVS